jgi:CDGSH-type Zn-finger protein
MKYIDRKTGQEQMEIKLKAGKKYKICSCGLSKSLPFCDNTHREHNASYNTEYKSVKITPDKDTVIQVISSRWKSIKESK